LKISGFTFVKNATKLFFPIKESIESILPIVDEFIVLVSEGDEDDFTKEEIGKINSDKIKLIPSRWDKENFRQNTVYAHETDKAMKHCSGDWLFYLQSDEIVHEKYLDQISRACAYYLDAREVEGFLFEYKHFWGDFNHYFQSHTWYPREIRIIRNRGDIHSWRDAQSFRIFRQFNGTSEDYLRKAGTRKLNVARINCEIYHYGWVRPPWVMTTKTKSVDPHLGAQLKDGYFDYGPLNKLELYSETHPNVLKPWIEKIFDWGEELQISGKRNKNRPPYKHERLKYRLLSLIENTLLGGNQIGGFKNYNIIRDFAKDMDQT
jgi:glycosyltransferase involved in cell wall biosynthesis